MLSRFPILKMTWIYWGGSQEDQLCDLGRSIPLPGEFAYLHLTLNVPPAF